MSHILEGSAHTLFFDGCSKGNPGPSGAGAVIYDENNNELWGNSSFVGIKETNNVAEYSGLLLGLNEAIKRNINNLVVKGDSKLVIEQLKGSYKVKSARLLPFYEKAKNLSKNIKSVQFEHVYRTENKRADELSNKGLSRN
jgi:ribonuclease HI